jgi:ubiquinone/menaquinone biosynthesis C-methylase UbiE
MAGPMYHLTQTSDRRLAVREAVRVLRPGGVIAVIAINRAANLLGATLANTLQHRRSIVRTYSVTASAQRTSAWRTPPITRSRNCGASWRHLSPRWRCTA